MAETTPSSGTWGPLGDGAAAERWLGQALSLARESVRSGGGPFGALVVHDGVVVATGVNRVTATLDPTAHAEVVAIRAACRALRDFRLTGCVLVSSCEPCPMCLTAALWARMDTVLYAADRHDAARAGFDDRAFYDVLGSAAGPSPLSVVRAAHAAALSPFEDWERRTGRVDY